jgi:predicted dehydrogenase
MWSPKLEQTEALRAEAKYFIECISNNERPFNDGVAGLRVVRILEAADKSLKDKGKPIRL